MGLLDNVPDEVWQWLFEAIKGLMGNCLVASEDAVIGEMRNPGPFTRVRLRRAAKRDNVTVTADQWSTIFQRGATASQLELQTLVRDSWGAF